MHDVSHRHCVYFSQDHITEQQQRLDDFELATKQMAEELDKREIEVKVRFSGSLYVMPRGTRSSEFETSFKHHYYSPERRTEFKAQ